MTDGVLVGVDLGGTNIRAAVATDHAQHESLVDHRTPAEEGPDRVLDAVAAAVRAAAGQRPVRGLAIGIPGPLDPLRGIVFAAPHLRGWTDVPAAEMLSQRLGCPVAIHNDASLAGYAEWAAGAGRGSRHFVFMTVSTGVGGCIVIDGELLAGAAGTAGEVGHVPIDPDDPPCGQGHAGCLEGSASGTAIAQRAIAALAAGEASSLHDLPTNALDAAAVQRAAESGDALSLRLFADAGRVLGRAIGGLINTLSPEVIVIGGGMIKAGDILFAPLRAAVLEMGFAVPVRACRIVTAGLGTDAGLVGAVAWAQRTFGDGDKTASAARPGF